MEEIRLTQTPETNNTFGNYRQCPKTGNYCTCGNSLCALQLAEAAQQAESGFQLCPKCNGEGAYYPTLANGLVGCDVCNGKKIINKITGQPPL